MPNVRNYMPWSRNIKRQLDEIEEVFERCEEEINEINERTKLLDQQFNEIRKEGKKFFDD